MKVVENRILPLFGFKAMTILCWIFIRKGTELSETDENHEAIHWKQEKELLIIGFYLLYIFMYIYECVRCLFDGERGKTDNSWRNGVGRRAYRSVAFEKEAYQHEDDMLYVYNRKHYAWIRR